MVGSGGGTGFGGNLSLEVIRADGSRESVPLVRRVPPMLVLYRLTKKGVQRCRVLVRSYLS